MSLGLCRVQFDGEKRVSRESGIPIHTAQRPQKGAELTLKPLSDTLRPIIDPRIARTAHPGRPSYPHEEHPLHYDPLRHDNLDN